LFHHALFVLGLIKNVFAKVTKIPQTMMTSLACGSDFADFEVNIVIFEV